MSEWVLPQEVRVDPGPGQVRWAHFALGLQRLFAHAAAFVLLPPLVLWLRWIRGYRIRDLAQVRSRARALLAGVRGPVLLCGNHLTWIDSMLIQLALTSPLWLLFRFRQFAWNLPERSRTRKNPWLGALSFLAKCVPVARGGDRREQRLAFLKVSHLLSRGEWVLIFPEGRRSDTGRVDRRSPALGVGRILKSLPGCQVLVVHLRGDLQETKSLLPARRQAFEVDLALITPHALARGLAQTKELTLQVLDELVALEGRYFARRQRRG